ncbi:hypothetical protein SADUNF_Sadunf13G0021000 [Salix dunnii]|uniref:Uncharacterized protein n=1 Tax=Salix dunnii TaxID=1413687 RepID=A0A835MQS2_9ROSI|nr:hypothetical protein SADUNF_Sadunf13G0021000 [Salix dunnii]
MDINPSQAANRSLSAERTESFLDSKVIANTGRLGNYFGPDLKGEGPPKSLFQRAAEGLPMFDQLTGSRMGTVEMERIYYYAVRKAEKHLAVKLLPLQQFFLGNLLTPGTNRYPQFTDMFPAHLHPHSVMEMGINLYQLSIIFINNPDTSHIDLKDIERFKRLTVHEAGHGIEFPPTSNRFSRDRAEPADRIPQSWHQHIQDKDELSALMAAIKTGLALTGNAAMGQVGQVDGPVDPRQLTGNLGDDGILEALIMKSRETTVLNSSMHAKLQRITASKWKNLGLFFTFSPLLPPFHVVVGHLTNEIFSIASKTKDDQID